MPSLNELVRQHTTLDETDLAWLHLLVSDWQLLADLSFADLVLWVETTDRQRYVAVAQMRPTTGPTAYPQDLVGDFLNKGVRPLLDAAHTEGRILREGDPEWRDTVPVRVESIPVRRDGRVIAAISRNTNLLTARTPSRLELTYLQTASDLAQMVAEGRFPQIGAGTEAGVAGPRVGDGLLRLDQDGVVQYASPNALSAFRRLGLATDLVSTQLGRTTAALAAPSRQPVDEALEVVCGGRSPRHTEVTAGTGVISLRAIPLDPGGRRIGALVLVRDVTELRRREQELMTKDATIREIHHRVKNNLQTVAALLRLQGRRVRAPEAATALAEAVRRVAAIAMVHETLSQALDEKVEFDEIADRVMSMVTELSAGPAGASVVPRREGTFGVLDADRATPLAVVLNELLQNALEHGLADGGGELVVLADREPAVPGEWPERLRVAVEDSGRGLPPGFDVEAGANLGLQIVRTLVTGELGGQFEMGDRPSGGTRIFLDIPLG